MPWWRLNTCQVLVLVLPTRSNASFRRAQTLPSDALKRFLPTRSRHMLEAVTLVRQQYEVGSAGDGPLLGLMVPVLLAVLLVVLLDPGPHGVGVAVASVSLQALVGRDRI